MTTEVKLRKSSHAHYKYEPGNHMHYRCKSRVGWDVLMQHLIELRRKFLRSITLGAIALGLVVSAHGQELIDQKQHDSQPRKHKTAELGAQVKPVPQQREAGRSRVDPVRGVPDGKEPQTKANWNVGASAAPGGTSINVWWDAQPGLTYTVCWKEVGKLGLVCWYNDSVEITAGGSGFNFGVQNAGIHNLMCETEYKVRVKMNFSGDNTTVTTASCGCSDPCPHGGWYDGANCQIGQAPAGTTAFIWSGNYYYSALPGNQCPYEDGWFDGANCYVQAVPAGVDPFIYANHWYYKACP